MTEMHILYPEDDHLGEHKVNYLNFIDNIYLTNQLFHTDKLHFGKKKKNPSTYNLTKSFGLQQMIKQSCVEQKQVQPSIDMSSSNTLDD